MTFHTPTTKVSVILAATLFALLVLLPQVAQAAPSVDIDPVDRGWWSGTGVHNSGQKNYCVGGGCATGGTHNFFVFDLPSTGYGVISAVLVLENPLGAGSPRPFVPREVEAPSGDVRANHPVGDAAGQAIYEDLGGGLEFGRTTPATVGTSPVAVGFNARGVIWLTRHTGERIVIGGELAGTASGDYLFGASGVANDISLQYYYGPNSALSISAPNRVPRGTRVTVQGRLTQDHPGLVDCIFGNPLEVMVGHDHRNVMTDNRGDYSFRFRAQRRTKVEVLFEGNDCAPDVVNKVVKIR